jgi:hypothetical protein
MAAAKHEIANRLALIPLLLQRMFVLLKIKVERGREHEQPYSL